MFRKSRIVWVSIVAALVVASLGAGGVMAAKILNPVGEDGMISGAYQKENGMLRLVNGEEDVRKSEVFIQWNQQGVQGEPGATGPAGPTGETGPDGLRGPAGLPGEPGLDGQQGDIGPIGEMGPAGLAGADGAAGADGQTGDTGPAGLPGELGAMGPAGADGATGATGPIGPPGAPEFRVIQESYIRYWGSGTVVGCVIEAPPGWQVVSGGFNFGPTSRDLKLITSIPQISGELTDPPRSWLCMFEAPLLPMHTGGVIEMYAVVTPLQEE